MHMDPKPTVGVDAIECNIRYYDAEIEQAQQALVLATANRAKWQQALDAENKIVDSGTVSLKPLR